jgi:hypothetical protein
VASPGQYSWLVADAKPVAAALPSLHDASLGRFALMTRSKLLLKDDFRDGLDLTGGWAITRFPPRFSADDGIVSTSDRGLYVKAAGTNPQTGEPAFSETAAGEDDHVKWMIDTLHASSNSVPGFDAAPGQELQIIMRARGRTFGTAAHPFGSAVTNPDIDLRLASFAMNTIDLETGMVFDVWMTNNAIYPYYERLNLTGTATYAVFSSVFPPVSRTPDEQAKVAVAYDRAAGTVRWLVNDAEAARVSKIGFPAPDATMIIDHGGTPELIAPRQLNCGMAMFTLLDGGLAPSGIGLVSLAPPYIFPARFAGGPNLFGQGAELHVERFEVQSSTED